MTAKSRLRLSIETKNKAKVTQPLGCEVCILEISSNSSNSFRCTEHGLGALAQSIKVVAMVATFCGCCAHHGVREG
jgi:hypothetical protein